MTCPRRLTGSFSTISHTNVEINAEVSVDHAITGSSDGFPGYVWVSGNKASRPFVLDADDDLACCLMHDYRRRPTPLVTEDHAGFAICWEDEFAIEQGTFWTISRDGRRMAHGGVPVEEIERFVRAAKSRRA